MVLDDLLSVADGSRGRSADWSPVFQFLHGMNSYPVRDDPTPLKSRGELASFIETLTGGETNSWSANVLISRSSRYLSCLPRKSL